MATKKVGHYLIVARDPRNPDNKVQYKWPRNIMNMSAVLEMMMGDLSIDAPESEDIDGGGVEIEVRSTVLAYIEQWCQHHINDPAPDPNSPPTRATLELVPFDRQLLGGMRREHGDSIIYEILSGANYMEIPALKDTVVKYIASWIVGKTPQEIRDILKLENDITTAEANRMSQHNQWSQP